MVQTVENVKKRKQAQMPVLPAKEAEIQVCDSAFNEICNYLEKQPGCGVELPLLEKAYTKAKELHGDTRRYSGVLYLRHPLAVMKSLARLLCKTSVLVAALLHDTVEDCGYSLECMRAEFTPEIAEIVAAVTEIKREEREHKDDFQKMTAQEIHDFLDRLTDAKLIQTQYQREAFLVRFADRENNLATLDACEPAKRRRKVEQTETFLIPAARLLGMHYYEIVLQDYCRSYHDDGFAVTAIKKLRDDYLILSRSAFNEFEDALQNGIEHQSFFAFPAYNPLAKIRGVRRNGRDELQIKKRRTLSAREIQRQLGENITFLRRDVCLSEVLLTGAETDKSRMMSEFINFYKEFLKPHKMFFEFDSEENEAVIIKLSDRYENNYRIVLVPAERLENYFIGDPNGECLTMVDEHSLGDALRPKMTVYSYSPDRGVRAFTNLVPVGATALDFAFYVSAAMALTVTGAQIRKIDSGEIHFSAADYSYPVQTILNEGDVVHFVADYKPRAEREKDRAAGRKPAYTVQVDWFRYINTEHARNCLINYFKPFMPEP